MRIASMMEEESTLDDKTLKEKAESHLREGISAYRSKQFDKAISELQEALNLDPRYTSAHNNLGIIHTEQDHLDAAESAFKSALTIEPNSAGLHNNLGNVLSAKGQIIQALEEFVTSIELEPGNPESYNNKGAAYYVSGMFRLAVNNFRKAFELDPKNQRIHKNLIRALNLNGNTEEKIQECLKFYEARSVEQKPIPSELEQQISEYRKKVEKSPNSARLHDCLGDKLVESKQFQEAETAYKKAIELDPSHIIGKFGLALTFYYSKNMGASEKEYRELLNLQPTNSSAMNNLACALEELGKKQEALEFFIKSTESKDPSKVSFTNVGRMYMGLGEIEKSVEWYIRSIKTYPGYTKAQKQFLSELQKPDVLNYVKESDVVPLLESRATLEPKNAGIQIALGILYSSTGDTNKSHRAYQKGIILLGEINFDPSEKAEKIYNFREK